MTRKTLEYYQGLPYHRRHDTFQDEETGRLYYVASVVELPGCKVEDESVAGAYRALENLFDEYVEAKLDRGSPIPEPKWRPTGSVQPLQIVSWDIGAVGLDGEAATADDPEDIDLGQRELQPT